MREKGSFRTNASEVFVLSFMAVIHGGGLVADQHVDLTDDVGVELDVQIVLAVGADGVRKLDLALIHGDAVILGQLICDI